jgi:aspartyl-tRNA(Asn)/glutamyl-tRNA(Gln) amidotransferase subunit C
MAKTETVSREEIQKIARLAKLHLDEAKCEIYTHQINAILEHVQTLGAADVNDVEPLSHVLDLVNVARKDEPAGSLKRDKVLGNTPLTGEDNSEERATDGEFFLVPQVIQTDR